LDRVFLGDAYQVLRSFPSNSVNLIITSPPYYKQRDYGGIGIGNEDTVEQYIENLIKVLAECVRVLKDEGSIVFNLGDKYMNGSLILVPYRFAISAIDRLNIKLVNHITWVKTNPTPRQYKKRLVPSTEPFFHFVKSDRYYFNPEEFMKEDKETNHASLRKNPGRKYFELIEMSNLTQEEKEKAYKELMDAIEEVKKGIIKDFRMKIRGVHAEPFGGQEGGRMYHLRKKGFTIIKMKGESIKRDVIECSVETIKGRKHSAIYPRKLVAEFIKLLSKEGDLVLDPFAGSGTTLLVAKELKRHYVGIEINPEYYQYILQRLEKEQHSMSEGLFI
ncbi:MAG: site-specific DNA-methyltransferase, partial [Aquificaceae bacterium]|nr:site-specific DNA-methyltransferase [Aquificaceae bacterium]